LSKPFFANHVEADDVNMESVDKHGKWTKVLFNPTDAVEVTEPAGNGKQIRGIRKLQSEEQLPSGGVIVKNGWDHEHCELCWSDVNRGDRTADFRVKPGPEGVCRGCARFGGCDVHVSTDCR